MQWIKFNDTNSFMTNHQEIQKQALVYEENVSKTTEDDAEKILYEDMANTESISIEDLDQETDVILTQRDTNTFITHQGIENEILVEENHSRTTEENDEAIFQEDMDNGGSNSVGDLDQETDVILTQREIVHDQESSDYEKFEDD